MDLQALARADRTIPSVAVNDQAINREDVTDTY
jgi:hypothetical protein